MNYINSLICLAILWQPILRTRVCQAESFASLYPAMEFSDSQMVTAIIAPGNHAKTNDPVTRISVFTRYTPGNEQGITNKNSPASMRSGRVRLAAAFELDYEPELVRLSNAHIALVDQHGVNRNWLHNNAAIRLVSLAGSDEIRIGLSQLFPDAEYAYQSEYRLGWLANAWFSSDGRCFFIAIKKRKGATTFDVLRSISTVDGSIKVIGSASLDGVFQQCESRFHATLFDVAIDQCNKSLERIARSIWHNKDESANVRLHAAGYLYWQSRDNDAVSYIRSVADLATVVQGVTLVNGAELIVEYDDDPITFALNFVRRHECEVDETNASEPLGNEK